MRELDPFSFYINHASAISGQGGANLSPDPRYCFHTQYALVRSGSARFELVLEGVKASCGQLALRVHAFRPETGENASLVAGARVDFEPDGIKDIHINVPFFAMRDVHYAFYGYFIEESDVRAKAVKILLHESEGEEDNYVEPPRSILAQDAEVREVRPANALIHVVTPHLTSPVSQDCTALQMARLRLEEGMGGDPDRWAEVLCLNALNAYGVVAPALEGLVVGPCSDNFMQALRTKGFALQAQEANPAPPATLGLFGDFMVWPRGLWPEESAAQRWEIIKAWFGCLKIGGVGIATCRYRPSVGLRSSRNSLDAGDINQNEIGQWALKLIASGYSVAPLAFSGPDELVLDAEGFARFALIAKRI